MLRRCLGVFFAHHRQYRTIDGDTDPFGEQSGWDGPLVGSLWRDVDVNRVNEAKKDFATTHYGPDWARDKHIFAQATASVKKSDLTHSKGTKKTVSASEASVAVMTPVEVLQTPPPPPPPQLVEKGKDPKLWSAEEVEAWVRAHVEPGIDMGIVEEVLEAFRLVPVTGKSLLDLSPPNLFKEMRRSVLHSDQKDVKISITLLQETVLLCFRYGGANSPWK